MRLQLLDDYSDWNNDNLNLMKHMMWLDENKEEAWEHITNSLIDFLFYGEGREELEELVNNQIGFYPKRYFKFLRCRLT